MNKIKYLIIVVSVGVLGAQVLPPFMGQRFQSFRYLSTAGLMEDDFDLLLDPGRYFDIKNNLLYTGLSNFATNSDRAFSGWDGTHFMFGFKNTFNPMGSPLPLSLLYAHQTRRDPQWNYLGGTGETENYIHEKYDTDGNGSYDSLHTEKIISSSFSEFKEVPFFIGVAKDLGNMKAGLFFHRFKYAESFEAPGDRSIDPYGNFSYLREERDLITGRLLEKEEWNGSHKIDSVIQGNLFGGSVYIINIIPAVNLGIQVGYGIGSLNYKENANTEGYIDYNPGGSLSREDFTYRRNFEIAPGGSLYFLRLYGKRILNKNYNTEDYFYLSFWGRGFSKTQTTFENVTEDYLRDDLGTGVLRESRLTDKAYGNLEYGESSKSFLLGYRYKGFIDKEKRVYFAIGFFFGNSVFNSTFKADSNFETVNYFNDGDNEPDDPDDFTSTTTFSKSNQLERSSSIRTIELPAACEFKLTKSLYFRIGANPYFIFTENETTNTPLSSTSRVTRTVWGDGTESVDVEPVQTDTGTRDKSISKTSGVSYSYGLSYKIGNNFVLDLMGFAILTNMQSWRVSITFKF